MSAALTALAWIAAGSAFGGIGRHLVSGLVARAAGETFPWGTMAVNVSGSMAIGALAAAASHSLLTAVPLSWEALAVGFLGSYTTVSSFSLQTLALARDGQWKRAAANIVLALALCLWGATLGFAVAAAAILHSS